MEAPVCTQMAGIRQEVVVILGKIVVREKGFIKRDYNKFNKINF